jgi:signal transduction histidine kinase
MFDLPINDSSAEGNSQLKAVNKGTGMNPIENNILSSPTALTGMSHEMRTHMNAIVAFSFLMKDISCTISDREEFSNQILNSCEQLLGLFDSFLDSAIIDTGNSKAESRICNLDNFLDDFLSEFRDTINNESHKNLELITEIPFTNSTEVFIDRNKLFRVIRSLFQNSIKNTKSGYIKIGYHFNNDTITFYVLDSGQGYFKNREFLQSENLNESLTLYNDTYSAINISLAKKLIQLLGGAIWIEKNGLTGSGMYFSVPVTVAAKSSENINKYVNTMISI